MKLNKQSLGYAILEAILNIITIPFVLFPVMFLPMVCLDNLLDGALDDHKMLTGIIFIILFGAAEGFLYASRSDKEEAEDEKQHRYSPSSFPPSSFEYRTLSAMAEKERKRRNKKSAKAWILAILIVVAYIVLFFYLAYE